MNSILLFQNDFIAENRVAITGRRLQHIMHVQRALCGDTLKVGVLNGNLGTGTVCSIDATCCLMDVELSTPPPAAMPLTLILALPRPKVFQRLLECVTAMGVKKIYILETWRVEKSYWSSPVLNEDESRPHVIAGLEQCCDTMMPTIECKKRFKPFVEDEIPEIIKNTKAFVAHPGSEAKCPAGISGSATLAIGPEGGFIPYEIEMLIKQGFKAVGFGTRILRVEHVVPAILGKLF